MGVAVFTIGHSNLALELFLDLVCSHKIEVLADVRSSPYSQYAPQFNREPLGEALRGRGTDYLFVGDALGGRPPGDEYYDDRGRVLYDRVAASPAFQAGVDRVASVFRRRRGAVMCSEEDPSECHRRLLVGRVLAERGFAVFHVRGDGRVEEEVQLARAERQRKTGGQKTLFDLEDPPPWKSTRSVSPKRAQPSSSACSGEPGSVDSSTCG